MMTGLDDTNSQRNHDFLSLYVQNQKRIYGYILSVVSNWSRAEDIMQETTLLMWRKFDDFRQGTSFSGWGIQIAKYKIREFRRKVRKETGLSQQVLDALSDRAEDYYTNDDARMKALEACINKLKAEDYALIRMRYAGNSTIKGMALSLGRSIQGLYKVMARIHANLVICVRRSLEAGAIE